MKYYTTLLVVLQMFSLEFGHAQSNNFTADQIREDLIFLKEHLLEKHPNIILNNTPAEVQDFFDRIEVPKTATPNEAYACIASVSSLVKDGHTYFYPDSEWMASPAGQSHCFPVSVFWDGADLYAVKDYSSNEQKEKEKVDIAGMKIIAINGVKSNVLISTMLQKMMRDGDNFAYPIWVINTYFFEYYNFLYGGSTEFRLTVEEKDGNSEEVIVAGVNRTPLMANIRRDKVNLNNLLQADFDEVTSTTTLTIRDWHNNILRKNKAPKFKKWLTQQFKEIEVQDPDHLIIDLRDNQGGNISNSKLLLSYLLESPFEMIKAFKKVKNRTLVPAKGPSTGLHPPKNYVYKGELFIIINGGSFSNTGIFSSALKKYNRGTFIGEETGGSEYLLCAQSKKITLPNTKVLVEIPRILFLLKDYETAQLSGVQPDHEVKPTIKSLLEGVDVQKNFVLELIRK